MASPHGALCTETASAPEMRVWLHKLRVSIPFSTGSCHFPPPHTHSHPGSAWVPHFHLEVSWPPVPPLLGHNVIPACPTARGADTHSTRALRGSHPGCSRPSLSNPTSPAQYLTSSLLPPVCGAPEFTTSDNILCLSPTPSSHPRAASHLTLCQVTSL